MADGFGERTWRSDFDVPLTGGRVQADDPGSFAATMRWLALDHVRVQMLVAGPHRYRRDTVEEVRADTGGPPIVTVAVAEGQVEFAFSDRTAVLQPGDVAISDEAAALGHRAPGPVRMLWSVTARRHVPDRLLTGIPFPAFLPRTRLVNSYLAFISALVTRQHVPAHETPDGHPARSIVDLQLGVLAERRGLAAAGDRR